jgi:hypothetical protein
VRHQVQIFACCRRPGAAWLVARAATLVSLVSLAAACTPIHGVQRKDGATGQGGESGAAGSNSITAESSGSSGSPAPEMVIAQAASACSEPSARACSEDDIRTPLVCRGTKWESQTACNKSERCEGTRGPRLGACVPIASECLEHDDGDVFCDGDAMRSCSKLVLTEPRGCGERKVCSEESGVAECVCGNNWRDQGDGMGCSAPTSCAEGNGGCDIETTCEIAAGQPTCTACPSGFEGTGDTACLAQLTELIVQDGTFALEPAFSPAQHEYVVKLPLLQQSIQLALKTPDTVSLDIDDVKLAAGTPWQSAPLPLGEQKIAINLNARSGRKSTYTLTVQRSGVQEAYIKAAASDNGDELGISTAIWGDTLVVGAAYDDSSSTDPNDDSRSDSGAVYVFVRSGGVWTQQAYLKAEPPVASDYFGLSVALREDLLVVGAPGATALASSTPHGGSVHVFKRSGEKWTFLDKLAPADTGVQDLFGQSVALDDKQLIAGAPFESGAETFGGAIYVFPRSGDSFAAPTMIRATPPLPSGLFGMSVALDGDTTVVGSPQYNFLRPTETSSGKAYVFTGGGAQWSQLQELQPSASLEDGATFGWTVAVAGDAIAVGAPRARATNEGQGPGDAYVYERAAAGGMWQLAKAFQAEVPRKSDWYGYSVKLSTTTLLVGSPGDASSSSGLLGDPNNDDAIESGATFMYGRDSNKSWLLTGYIKASNPDSPDGFGGVVALYGDTVVSTSSGEGSNATGVNGDQANNALMRAGAVYVFR